MFLKRVHRQVVQNVPSEQEVVAKHTNARVAAVVNLVAINDSTRAAHHEAKCISDEWQPKKRIDDVLSD